jgi:hypothetical protein
VLATYDAMVRISVTPAWARFFDFGAGRLPRFLEDLVSGDGATERRGDGATG